MSLHRLSKLAAALAAALLGASALAGTAVEVLPAGLRQPVAGAYVPASSTLWILDEALGLCPVPIVDGGGLPSLGECAPISATPIVPGQAAFDGEWLYVPDRGPASQGVLRARLDPATLRFGPFAPLPALATAEVRARRPSAVAVADGRLYVGYLLADQVDELEGAGTAAEVLRPAYATTAGLGGVLGLAFAADGLYLAEHAGVSRATEPFSPAALVPGLADVADARALAPTAAGGVLVAGRALFSTLVRFAEDPLAGPIADVLATEGVFASGAIDELREVAGLVPGPGGTIFVLDAVGDGGLASGRAWSLATAGPAEYAGVAVPQPVAGERNAKHMGVGLTAPRAILRDPLSDAFFVADGARGVCVLTNTLTLPLFAPETCVPAPGARALAYGTFEVLGRDGLPETEELLFVADEATVTRWRIVRDLFGVALSSPLVLAGGIDAASLAFGSDVWLYVGGESGRVRRLDPVWGLADGCGVEAPGATRVAGLAEVAGRLWLATDAGLLSVGLGDLPADPCPDLQDAPAFVAAGPPAAPAAVAGGVEADGGASLFWLERQGERSEVWALRLGPDLAPLGPPSRHAARGVLLESSAGAGLDARVAQTDLKNAAGLAYVSTAAGNPLVEGVYVVDDPLAGARAGAGRLWQVFAQEQAEIAAPAGGAFLATSTIAVTAAALPPGFVEPLLWDSDGAQPIFSDVPGGLGFTLAGAIEGPHALAILAVSPLAESSVSDVVNVVVDTVAPGTPLLSVPLAAQASAALRGTTEPFATVALTVKDAAGAVLSGPSPVRAGPTGYFAALAPLGAADGAYRLEAVPTDRAGNPGGLSSAVVLKDSAAPVVTLAAPAAVVGTAELVGGRLRVAGAAADASLAAGLPLSAAAFLDGAAAPAATAEVGASGEVVLEVAVPTRGEHQVVVVVTDAAGNAGASAPRAFLLQGAAPAAPALAALPAATNAEPLRISGTAEPGTTVAISANGALVATAVADAAGAWAADLAGLGEGTFTLTAVATEPTGLSGPASAPVAVTIDRTAPAVPTIASPGAGAVLRDRAVTVAGAAEPGASLRVTVDGGAAQAVEADGAGRWQLPLSLPFGTHRVEATSVDAAGNASAAASVAFTVEAASGGGSGGCASGAGGGAASLLLLGLAALRRRR